MRRYTTPTFVIRVNGLDLSGCDVHVTIKQRGNEVTISNPAMTLDESDTLLEVPLGQNETGVFAHGRCELQVNVVDQNGYRAASNIKTIEIDSNLLARVVRHG